MTTSACISALGLFIDIVGVALVFFFPILSGIDNENVVTYDEYSKTQLAGRKKVKFWGTAGFILIVVGFMCQLTGTVISGLK